MKGEIYGNGSISVFVPEGWKVFEGTDSEGVITSKRIYVYKNVERELDIFLKAGITICFFDENDYYLSPKSFYDNVSDLDPISIGGQLWERYTCTSLGYPYVMLTMSENDTVFQVMILLENGEEKISFEDIDVQRILESIRRDNDNGKEEKI